MSDRGPRYWLHWPHTRQDHLLAFVLFFGITIAAGYTDAVLAALFAAVVTMLLGVKLMAWSTEDVPEDEAAPE
jgi:hypothetical protein